MAAGAYNRRVTVKQPATGVDSIGQPLTTWTTVAQLWANILNKSGAQAIKAERDVSAMQTSIRIRYRTDITDAMRFEYGTIVYKIQAVLPDQSGHKHLDLVCEEVR